MAIKYCAQFRLTSTLGKFTCSCIQSPIIIRQSSYYAILGVSRTATKEEIKEAYYKKTKQYHPDKNINDETAHKKFVELQQAYGILSNPQRRRNYDGGGPKYSTYSGQRTTSDPHYYQNRQSSYQDPFQQSNFYRQPPKQHPINNNNKNIPVGILATVVIVGFIAGAAINQRIHKDGTSSAYSAFRGQHNSYGKNLYIRHAQVNAHLQKEQAKRKKKRKKELSEDEDIITDEMIAKLRKQLPETTNNQPIDLKTWK